MAVGCPRCGGRYIAPVSNNGTLHPEPLVEVNECTTCGLQFEVVIE